MSSARDPVPEQRPDPSGRRGRPLPLPRTRGNVPGADSRSSGRTERFHNILFFAGLDRGPVPRRALERALRLARANGAKLTFLDVVHQPKVFREILPHGMLARVRGDRCRALSSLAAEAQEQGVETETELALGKPFPEITRKVRRSGHDLLITPGALVPGAGAMDSTTMRLMRRCPCAIWVIRAHAPNRITRVLAAVDPDPTDPEKSSLNRRIVELATSMAKIERGELHVVHVGLPSGKPPGSSGEAWKRWQASARSEFYRRLSEFLADYDFGPDPRVHLVAGRPAVAISELASEERIDLLVMGTSCRTGVRGFFIGNTAEGVLERVDCSLLTVKPDDLVSPIQLA